MRGKGERAPAVPTPGHMCSQLGANQKAVIRGVASAGWQQGDFLKAPDECVRLMRRDEGSLPGSRSVPPSLPLSLPFSPPHSVCLHRANQDPEQSGLSDSCPLGLLKLFGVTDCAVRHTR